MAVSTKDKKVSLLNVLIYLLAMMIIIAIKAQTSKVYQFKELGITPLVGESYSVRLDTNGKTHTYRLLINYPVTIDGQKRDNWVEIQSSKNDIKGTELKNLLSANKNIEKYVYYTDKKIEMFDDITTISEYRIWWFLRALIFANIVMVILIKIKNWFMSPINLNN